MQKLIETYDDKKVCEISSKFPKSEAINCTFHDHVLRATIGYF